MINTTKINKKSILDKLFIFLGIKTKHGKKYLTIINNSLDECLD